MLLMDLGFVQIFLDVSMNITAGALEGVDTTDVADGATGKVLFASNPNDLQPGMPFNEGWPLYRGQSLEKGLGPAVTGLPLEQGCRDEIGYTVPFFFWFNTGCGMLPERGAWPAHSPLPNWEPSLVYGTAARWRNDDDRSFALKDEMDLTAALIGGVNLDLGIIVIGVDAQMSVTVASTVETIFREELDAADRSKTTFLPTPPATTDNQVAQTNVVATPIGENTVTIDPLSIFLDFAIHLGIFNFEWKPKILGFPDINISPDPVMPQEDDRLRVGEYSEVKKGGGMSTRSHLPEPDMGSSYEFAAQGQSVAACLSDPSSYGNEPNPTPTTPSKQKVPWGLCLYGPSPSGLNTWLGWTAPQIPDWSSFVPTSVSPIPPYTNVPANEICKNRAAAWPVTFQNPSQQQCIDFTIDYLCGKINNTQAHSRVVTLNGENVIAHLVDKVPGESDAFKQMWTDCLGSMVPVFFSTDPNDASLVALAKWATNAVASVFFQEFIRYEICCKETLLPVVPGQPDTCKPGQTSANLPPNCPNPDPMTGQCPPQTCKIDPATGQCVTNCPRDHNCTTPGGGTSTCGPQGCFTCARPNPLTGLCQPLCPPPKVPSNLGGDNAQCVCPLPCIYPKEPDPITCACGCPIPCIYPQTQDPFTCACSGSSGPPVCLACPTGQCADPMTCVCGACPSSCPPPLVPSNLPGDAKACVCSTQCYNPCDCQDPTTCACAPCTGGGPPP
jgi:hypothetical protein